jgi:endo-1,4-beta-mannosidase
MLCVVLWLGAFSHLSAAQDEARPPAPLAKVRIAADGRTFQTDDGKPFVPLGINYYRPGTGWAPQLWKKFDAEATRQDFARMRELGVNCVRVFLTYGSFFMDRDRLHPEGLAKFDQFLDMAEQAGVYVHPTGPDHWEGMPNWQPRDLAGDEPSLAALETFWGLFAARYRNRNVIFAYDLRNEPAVPWETPAMRGPWNAWLQARYRAADALAQAWSMPAEALRWGDQSAPPREALGSRQLLDYQQFREELADQWTRRQVAAIKAADPAALVTVGLIQWSVPALLPGVQQYSGFRPQRQAPLLDFLEIHFYPLAAGFYEYAPDDEIRNLAYLESVVRETAACGKPVVVAEFGWYGGGSLNLGGREHPVASEEAQARWCRRAVETTSGLATGWLNWGFYDHPEARDVSQRTGMLAVDGRPKAWAREFQKLAESLARERIAPAQLGPRPALDWDRCLTDPAAGREFLQQYGESFKAQYDPR